MACGKGGSVTGFGKFLRRIRDALISTPGSVVIRCGFPLQGSIFAVFRSALPTAASRK